MVKRCTLKGKHAGITFNDVLTEVEEEYQKPLRYEYKNARCMGKHAYFVRTMLFVDS